jgi:hypothetical protein
MAYEDQSQSLPPEIGGGAIKCRLCTCKLGISDNDDFEMQLCAECKTRPEAGRLGDPVIALPVDRTVGKQSIPPARDFTPAEKALIKRVHGFMSANQLLEILNERLVCDLGPDAGRYTMDQLYAEIGEAPPATPDGGHDWASLRKLLAKARREGLLDIITEQTIQDFGVVFSLNQKQLMTLKDTLLSQEED